MSEGEEKREVLTLFSGIAESGKLTVEEGEEGEKKGKGKLGKGEYLKGLKHVPVQGWGKLAVEDFWSDFKT